MHAVQHWRLPMVVWGAQAGAGPVVVGSDNRQAGIDVARYFVRSGRRAACFLGDLDYAENAERYAGFSAELGAHNVPVRCIQSVGFTAAAAAARMAIIDGPRMDAVFAASDLLAIGAIQALRERGLSVPGEVSVVGFDDTPVGASPEPPLSSVHQDLHAAGVLLARKVLDLIEGREAQSEMLPARLVLRAT